MSDPNPHTSDAGDTASASATERADAFVASLPDGAVRGSREILLARLGMAIVVIGVVVALVAVVLSQSSDNPLDQSTQLAMGVAGVALVGAGGVVFLRYSLGRLLRYWLLRVLDEQHRSPR